MAKVNLCFAESPLFDGLAARHLAVLSEAATRIELRKGQEIWRPGTAAEYLYLVLSGLVKRADLSSSGSERALELLHVGNCLGAAELLADRPYASHAIAVEPSTLLRFDGAIVRHVVEDAPSLGLRLGRMLARRQLDLEHELGANRSHSSSERLLSYLLHQASQPLARNGETPIYLAASKQLIASRIGITPETFSRALRELSDEGLIVASGRCIRLQNGPIVHRQHCAEQARIPNQCLRLATCADPALMAATSDQVSPYSLINMAGRQRMLSQRMAKYWLMLGCGVMPRRALKMLDQSIKLFDDQHLLLAGLLTTREQAADHSSVGRLWRQYKRLLARPQNLERARELFTLNEALLLAADRQVRAFSRDMATCEAHLVDLAGRQRMLAQRMAKFYLFFQYGIEARECQTGIDAALKEFAAAMTTLATATQAQPQFNSQLSKVSQFWISLRSMLEVPVAKADKGGRAAEVSKISDRLTRQMDDAVCQYARLAEAA